MKKQNKEAVFIPAAELSEEELQFIEKKGNKNYKNKKVKNAETVDLVDSFADISVETAESIIDLLKIPNTILQQVETTNEATFSVLINHTRKVNEKKN